MYLIGFKSGYRALGELENSVVPVRLRGCVRSWRAKLLGPPVVTVHGAQPGEVLGFAGASGLLERKDLHERDGFGYLLVTMHGLSKFMWLEPAAACITAIMVKHLLQWCEASRDAGNFGN